MIATVSSTPTGTLEQRTVWLSGEIITPLNKLVFPVVWLGFVCGIPLWVFLKFGRISISGGFRFIAVFVLISTVWMLWMSVHLERVGHAGRNLVISNYRRTSRVPFEQIESVDSVWWGRSRVVRIRFRRDTEFGSAVYYLPKWGCLRLFRGSAEKELRALIS